ncbi:zinc-binding dehydrogenase [Streptomyces albidoflavus]
MARAARRHPVPEPRRLRLAGHLARLRAAPAPGLPRVRGRRHPDRHRRHHPRLPRPGRPGARGRPAGPLRRRRHRPPRRPARPPARHHRDRRGRRPRQDRDGPGLGADLAVDYDRPAWSDEVRAHFGTGLPVTAVLDGVGGAKAAEAYGLLADGGRLVTIGCASGEWFAPDPEEAAARSVEVIPAIARWAASDVDRSLSRTRALDAGAHGSLKAAYQTFALSDAAHAHAEMAARRTTRKVVLLP